MVEIPDQAVGQVLEGLAIGVIVVSVVLLTVAYSPSNGGHGQAKRAYHQVGWQAHDIVSLGDAWCCPEDPSAASILQDRAMRAWAGDPDPLERVFEPWLAHPETTDFAVTASWAPPGGSATHTVDLYREDPSHGKTAGAQSPVRPSSRGPAYVVPRLENLSAESSADLLFVPVDHAWPYQIDPQGAHEDAIVTRVGYERTYGGDSGTHRVSMEAHGEVTGVPRPAVDVHFEEPDWVRLAGDLPIGVETDADERTFTQVLTKEDLIAERSLHDDGLAEPGVYPQHPFHVQVDVLGPGAIDTGTRRTAANGTTKNVTDAYRLEILVPRNWTDVEVTTEDRDDNAGTWTHTSVEVLAAGGHRITSYLNVTATFHVSWDGEGGASRWVLDGSSSIEAPFRFHARPPSDQASTELGFQSIRATLDSVRFPVRETSELTVEVASSPGRVHRSLDVTSPAIVPTTPWPDHPDGLPEGVELPLGAVLLNGGEATDVDNVTWTLPKHTVVEGRLTVLEDFTGEDPAKWSIDTTDEHVVVSWDPLRATGPQVTQCDQLSACSVAASLTFDGRPLNQQGLWAPPRLVTLYAEHDVEAFVDWFVRTDWAWEGIDLEDDRPPGFALAHRSLDGDAGPAHGSYRFTVQPTSKPTCSEGTIRDRDQADRYRHGGTVTYDFGPREDGLPQLAPDTGDGDLQDLELCPQGARRFVAIGEAGDRWRTEAIGKGSYRSVSGLSGQTVSKWQNGLAESEVQGPGEVPAGDVARFTVQIDSMLDTLTHQDVGNATLRVHALDPYNSWEGQPWLTWVVRENTGFQDPTDGVENGVQGGTPSTCDQTGRLKTCESEDKDEPIPPKLELEVSLPSSLVPGTHLLVVQVSWEFTTGAGEKVTETGNLIEPFDVLSAQGDRVQPSMLGVTAWAEDWR